MADAPFDLTAWDREWKAVWEARRAARTIVDDTHRASVAAEALLSYYERRAAELIETRDTARKECSHRWEGQGDHPHSGETHYKCAKCGADKWV